MSSNSGKGVPANRRAGVTKVFTTRCMLGMASTTVIWKGKV